MGLNCRGSRRSVHTNLRFVLIRLARLRVWFSHDNVSNANDLILRPQTFQKFEPPLMSPSPSPRILVIDDDDGVRMLLRRVLEQEGYEVEEAANGAIGVRAYRDSAADLVITDIIMPDKEGIGTILELREVQDDVKIIAISGGGRISSTDHLKTAEDLGVFCTFKKPFDRQELLDAIKSALAS